MKSILKHILKIADIVNDSLDVNVDPEAREIMEIVRHDVLKRLENANVGISGANAIAAEEGSLVMVHNEGNISIVSLKDLHIIVAGIDKIVPTLEDAISVVKLETKLCYYSCFSGSRWALNQGEFIICKGSLHCILLSIIKTI